MSSNIEFPQNQQLNDRGEMLKFRWHLLRNKMVTPQIFTLFYQLPIDISHLIGIQSNEISTESIYNSLVKRFMELRTKIFN